MRFHVHTYGCQMNQRDTEAVIAHLESQGFQLASNEAEADLVIVNTCSVRAKAEEKAFGKIGLLCASKRDRPRRRVGVMGCMAQRLGDQLIRQFPRLDFAVGSSQWSHIPEIVRTMTTGEASPVVRRMQDADAAGRTSLALDRHRGTGAISSWVTVLLGCNRRCAYCIVPEVRGPEFSRPADEILKEARECVATGTREITLLGQSVLNYGRGANDPWADTPPPAHYTEAFPRLLAALDAIPGLARIRFTSGHPSGCSPELVDAMRRLPTVCPHLHLPLQSGSDRILERMRRGYTRAQYLERVRQLRTAIPEIAISTDVIVGFPGETEADFQETRTVMQTVTFSQSFIFKYSPRPGTPAADWRDDVPAEEKMRRNQILLQDQDAAATRFNRLFVGQTVPVLIEGPSPRNPETWTGRSPQNTIVIFRPFPGIRPGDLHPIPITRATPQALYEFNESAS